MPKPKLNFAKRFPLKPWSTKKWGKVARKLQKVAYIFSKDISAHSVPHKLHKNNTTGIPGVYWRKDNNCYGVIIYRKGKKINLGSAKTLKEAKNKIKEYDQIN